HCRRTHTDTNGNSRPSSPRRIGAPPCHICLAFASDRGVSRPLTQVSARGRRRRQARPTFFASESIPCNAASRLVVPVISRSRIIDNSLVNVGGISLRNIIKVQKFDSPPLEHLRGCFQQLGQISHPIRATRAVKSKRTMWSSGAALLALLL